MATTLKQQLDTFDAWKHEACNIIDSYQNWLDENQLSNTELEFLLIKNKKLVEKNNLTVAFAAEFSRGKTELINALFFSNLGLRVLPSSPGRTTMCPTEIFHDPHEPPYLRLLDINTRLSGQHLADYKNDPRQWSQIDLDPNSPEAMRNAFQALLETKLVTADEAIELGFLDNTDSINNDQVEIPRWRHALISFPHPLLKKGLTILDTPGLNALGSEPELTLNMLPNVQAMIFILAADTGVTKSDMDMWQKHINSYHNKHPSSLAVVLNKIDGLTDDLMSDDEIHLLINKQVKETAKLLELDERLIFPLSAKQALIGKIKKDSATVDKSKINSLERFLTEHIVGSQKEILQTSVISDLSDTMSVSSNLLNTRLNSTKKHLEELDNIFHKSEQTTTELILESRKNQSIYNKNLAYLKTSRHVFMAQLSELEQVISPSRAKVIINDGAENIRQRWTSAGIRQSMQDTFDDLNTMLNETLNATSASIKLLNSIYKKFKDEHGLTCQQPKSFDISIYQQQLEQLLAEGIEFSNSPSATLTAQNTLAKRFVDTIGENAAHIFDVAIGDIRLWKASALSPLITDVKEQKKQVEKRLDSLKSVASGKETLENKIAENKLRLSATTDQLEKIKSLMARLDSSDSTPSSSYEEQATVQSF